MCAFSETLYTRGIVSGVVFFGFRGWWGDVGGRYHLGMFKGGPIGVLVVAEMGRDALGVERCMRGIDCDLLGMRRDVVWMSPAAGLNDRIVVVIVDVCAQSNMRFFLYTQECRGVSEWRRGVAYESKVCRGLEYKSLESNR